MKAIRVICIITISILAFGTISQAASLYVPTDYSTIQEAINAAEPNDTINIASGDYYENLLVNKAGLSFIGANAGISGSEIRSDETDIIGYVKITSNNISFNGFKLTDGNQVPAGEKAAIHIVGGTSGHIIQYNLFTRTGAAPNEPDLFRGIINEFGGVSSLQIKHNKFIGWHTGVYLQNAEALVTDNVMTGNYVGMSIDGAVSVTAAYNSFIDNGLEGLGIGPPPVSSLTVERNCFSGNPTAVANWQSIEVNAEYNSWGDASGPYNPASNPDGLGDAVSDNVDYTPWLAVCCGDPLHKYPVGDLSEDCRVNFRDFAVFASAWFSGEGDGNWNPVCNFESEDNYIDMLDLDIFASHWLECTASQCD